jgi:hypothetical protein
VVSEARECCPEESGTVEGQFCDISGMPGPERVVDEVCPTDELRGGWTRDPCKKYSKMEDFFVDLARIVAAEGI